MSRINNRLIRTGISHKRYMELLYFCRQYGEKKEQLNSMSFLKSTAFSETGIGNGGKNPTEKQALLMEELSRDIELIEDTVQETAPEIYKQLLQNVTEGTTYIYMDMPCGQEYFYKKRREFFKRLALKKSGQL